MWVLESSAIVMLLFYLADFANSFPSYFVKPSVPLNDFIKHYEPAFYNAEEVANQHKRIKRGVKENGKNNDPLRLTISTPNKVFKLVLQSDQYLFADDAIFEGENGKFIDFDRAKAYVGTLEDDERTKVRGIVTKDGLFDGTITTQFEEFYIEPVSRYKEANNNDKTHTIVYRTSDVIHPSTPLCVSENQAKQKPTDLNTIAHRRKRRKRNSNIFHPMYDIDSSLLYSNDELVHDKAVPSDDQSWPVFTNSNSTADLVSSYQSFRRFLDFHEHPSASHSNSILLKNERQHGGSRNSENIYYDLDLSNLNGGEKPLSDDSSRFILNDTLHQSNRPWRSKTPFIDTVYKYTNSSKSSKGYLPPSGIVNKSLPKILVGSGVEESRTNLIITNDDSLEQHARKRAIVDPKKTTCMLYLQADHLFFEKYGTEETCIEVMTRHVQRVNSIYRNTDFNQDGKPDNISFMIKRIKVHSNKDPAYRFPGNYGVEKFLEIFSEEDYDAFCLAYMFTYRDFEMGTLGLAWTGDLKNAGGVCEKNGHYRGSLKSLNTGIVTVLNYGKHVPSAVSHVTLAHEIGHNFGSPHDPDGCTPGGDDGNFIMFARATSGDKKNNNKFSPCSLHAINPVLNVKARSSKGCFTEPQTSICGNGVVEPDEECDCGWEEDCKDKCCFPQRRYPPLDEPPCHLTSNSICSPSQGPCCTPECTIKTGDMCRSDNGCRDSSYCNGVSPQCPPSINKPNKTVCNEEFVCYMGECTGSICLAYGLESCQCIPKPSDPPTKACELCCKLPGENQQCLSSFEWNQAPYDVPDMFAKPGTPCNDYNGYCDVFRKCREVDPSGPIATLRKLLLSEENIASFKKWAYEHWYYCALVFFTFVLIMVISTKVLGKKPKLKSVTVIHSSPTETVRLPTDGSGGPAVVVHPIAVRKKLPLKKKVRENKRRNKSNRKEEPNTQNTSGNSPAATAADAKKKNRNDANGKTPNKNDAIVASEDPLGKVRNWLISSHNIESLGSLKKSKSSPASFDLSDPTGMKKRQKRPNVGKTNAPNVKSETKKNKKLKDAKVKLQVVYKPPFKFSVKLGKHKNEISSQLIKDKRPEAVKQRAALLIRADRIRSAGTNPTPANVPASAPNAGVTNVSKNVKNEGEKVKSQVRMDKTKASKSKVEYRRSISAPASQQEPLYANTFQPVSTARNEDQTLAEEPQYANIVCNDKEGENDTNNLHKIKEEGRHRTSQRSNHRNDVTIKRRSSCDIRNSISKPVSSSRIVGAKRRNSCDTKNPFLVASVVKNDDTNFKRQFSDDLTGIRAVAVDDFKRKPTSIKRTSSGEQKSANFSRGVNQKKSSSGRKNGNERNSISYSDKLKKNTEEDQNLISFTSPSHSKSTSHRKLSYDIGVVSDSLPQNLTALVDASTLKDKRPQIKRSTSGSAERNEAERFKRYSLQSTENPKFPGFSDFDEKVVPSPAVVNRELIVTPFCQSEIVSDIPSDLEVLLSETENTIEP